MIMKMKIKDKNVKVMSWMTINNVKINMIMKVKQNVMLTMKKMKRQARWRQCGCAVKK